MIPLEINKRGNARNANQKQPHFPPANGYSGQYNGQRPPHNNQYPPQGQHIQPQGQHPPPQFGQPLNMPRQRANGPTNPRGPAAYLDPRKYVISQIQRDCYSKIVSVDGQMIPEIKYNTHLAIREYSQFPLSRPPADMAPSQLGTVKNRILVVSTKHTGRVLLQKGKYAEGKQIYQIGRTWDLDELVCITRLSADEIILHLNKKYYWRSGEGADRLVKFIHHLAVIYHKFTGQYPELRGITLEELNLSPTSKHPYGHDNANSSVSMAGASQNSLPSKKAFNPDHYKDMDFTVNGKLPLKPMQVLDVDRPSPINTPSPTFLDSQSYRSQTESFLTERANSSTSSFRGNPRNGTFLSPDMSQDNLSANESHSFIFGADDKETDEGKETLNLSEYAKQNGSLLPLRNYRPEKSQPLNRNVSENLETAASYGLQLQDQLENNEVSQDSIKFQTDVRDDLALDEEKESINEAEPPKLGAGRSGHDTSESLPNALLNEINEPSAIDSSIKDIEEFMDTQFGKEKVSTKGLGSLSLKTSLAAAAHSNESIGDSKSTFSKKLAKASLSIDESDSRSNFLYEENPISVRISDSAETLETDVDIAKEEDLAFEKDAEIDELLDEIGWDAIDGTDKSVKLLRRELTSIKHKSVHQLTTLDFGKDSLIKEVLVSLSEINNLVGIFKKMEASLNLLAPEINNIEDNSKGLQVEAVNKKILYNELSEILNKVRLSGQDLEAVANFNDFEDVPMIPLLESKLLMLYDALVAIGSKSSNDNLAGMKALKQFCEEYEYVASAFSEKFLAYVVVEFRSTIEGFNLELNYISHDDILVRLRKVFAYEGISSFVKCVSEKTCVTMNDKFSSYMGTFVDSLLSVKIRVLFSNNRNSSQRNSMRFSGNDSAMNLRKTKSSRFGSTRLLAKFANTEEPAKPKQGTPAAKDSDEIGDARAILQILDDSKELMLVTQFFFGHFFHSTSLEEYSEYIRQNSYDDRMKLYERRDYDTIDYKTNSNELLRNMNQIFGNFINRFIKKVVPSDLIIPQLLIEVYHRLKEADSRSQDFVAYSFLLKVANRFKNSWNKCIAHQVDLLNKSDVRGKGEILSSVKNMGHIIMTTETSLQESNKDIGESRAVFDQLIKSSYEQLTKGAVDLFEREDPLLKSNNHDEREKAHRNVAILQNLFTLLQQLNEFDSETTAGMKQELNNVFNKTQGEYFRYIVQRNFRKIYDYVRGHGENDSAGTRRKEDKILLRGIASTHSAREVALKIQEIRRKMEKHIVTTNTVFEQDLFEVMWKGMEDEVSNLFLTFYEIAQPFDKDLDGCVSSREIRRLFH